MRKIIKFIAIVLSIFVLIHLADDGYKLIMHSLFPNRHTELIEEYSEKYDLDKFLVMAVIKAESNYIHDAHSGVARGLMQITDSTALWISKELDIPFKDGDLENPAKNIEFGCFYLSYLLDYYNNDETLALAAYNAGLGNVRSWLKNPEHSPDGVHLESIPFRETREYVEKIKRYKIIYKKLYQ